MRYDGGVNRPPTLAWHVHGRIAPENGATLHERRNTELYNTLRVMGGGLIKVTLLGATRGSGYQPQETSQHIPPAAAARFPGRLLTEVTLVPEDAGNPPALVFEHILTMRRSLEYLHNAVVPDIFLDVSAEPLLPLERVREYAGLLIIPRFNSVHPDILTELNRGGEAG